MQIRFQTPCKSIINSKISFQLLFLLFVSHSIIAQTSITSIIIDSQSKQAIAYCNIYNKTTQNGVISNANGEFSIKIHSVDDLISISFLGYETQNIPAKKILQWNSISLKQKQYLLQEVEIHSDNDYLFDILIDCRKTIKKSKREQVSKAFFILHTSSKQKPLELLECYYNARQKGGHLETLGLKNGRFALLPSDSRFFLNRNTSQVFNVLDLVNRNELLPDIILQFGKRGMKKCFDLKLEFSDGELYKISFNPKEKNGKIFSGDIWIDKNSKLIKKITLDADSINKHPFIAFANDSIADISIKTTYSFAQNDTILSIEKIIFDMNISYYSISGSMILANHLPDIKREIKISSILYLYDYNKPFILPYFEYNNLYTDYRKLSIIPYNEIFWQNRKILLTEEQKQQMKTMSNDGYFVNYDPKNYGVNFMKKQFNRSFFTKNGFWEHLSHLFWSESTRINLKKDVIEEQKPQANYQRYKTPQDLYNFSVQILLDINPIDSVYDFKSYTIFDLSKTYYLLDINENSNTFINIYFDICEVERRKMERKLLQHNTSLPEIDSIYQQTLSNIEKITNQYMKEVQRGNNTGLLEKWEEYIHNELGIIN